MHFDTTPSPVHCRETRGVLESILAQVTRLMGLYGVPSSAVFLAAVDPETDKTHLVALPTKKLLSPDEPGDPSNPPIDALRAVALHAAMVSAAPHANPAGWWSGILVAEGSPDQGRAIAHVITPGCAWMADVTAKWDTPEECPNLDRPNAWDRGIVRFTAPHNAN